MRLPGYCESCHRIKQVTVSPSRLAMGAVRGGAYTGICSDCEEEERNPSDRCKDCGATIRFDRRSRQWKGKSGRVVCGNDPGYPVRRHTPVGVHPRRDVHPRREVSR